MHKDNLDRDSYKPIKLSPKVDFHKQLEKLGFGHKGAASISDQYEGQLEELFLIRHPQYRFNKDYQGELQKFVKQHSKGKIHQSGNWFYYPWLNTVIHVLPEKEFIETKTGRNRNLISQKEQDKYYNSVIGVMGMSVGSHVATTIALTGGAKHIKLADLDKLSLSNLNRIRTGVQNLEVPKVYAVARQIYEMNPYSVVDVFTDGVTDSNLEKIIAKPKLSVLVEEMDNPYFKLKVREVARKHKVPVIMAADNHDGVIADVERYDTHPKYPLLHGIMGKMTSEEFRHLPPQQLPGVIAKMAGAELSSLRMIESVMEVGKTIYSWPQLGTAANLCGSVLAMLARRIVVGEKIVSGRYDVNISNFFIKPTSAEEAKKHALLKMMGIVK
jgi:molybdopterin/thiamine biosynthesis adenylyltransferase